MYMALGKAPGLTNVHTLMLGDRFGSHCPLLETEYLTQRTKHYLMLECETRHLWKYSVGQSASVGPTAPAVWSTTSQMPSTCDSRIDSQRKVLDPRK